MDFFLIIVLNNIHQNKSSKSCGNFQDSLNLTATNASSSTESINQIKNCKVVLEDIAVSCGAVKLQVLDSCQDKTHTSKPHHTSDSDFLRNLQMKTPIAWANLTDKP